MPTIPVSTSWGPTYTGLTDVEYKVVDSSSTIQIDWTDAGVTELLSSTGVYGANIYFDPAWGSVNLLWRVVSNSGLTFSETLNLPVITAPSTLNIQGNYPVSINWGATYTGQRLSVQYQVYDNAGNILAAWSNTGVVESQAGSGLYRTTISFNLAWGFVRVLWRIQGTSLAAAQWVNAAQTGVGTLTGSLNVIQRWAYKQKCDIWRKDAAGSGPIVGTQSDRSTWSRVYQDVAWRDQTTRYNSQTGPVGRQDDPNFLTRNDGHFHYTIDLRDGDVVVETTQGVVPADSSFICVGQGEIRPEYPANYCHVDLQRFVLTGTNIAEAYE